MWSIMSTLDTIIAVVLVLSGALGIYWGFIRQVLSIAGLIAGLVLASRYGGTVAEWLSSYISNIAIAQVLGFMFVLIAVSATASLLATVLRRFVGLLFLGWLDHLIGGLLGVLQGALACTILIIALAAFPTDFWSRALADSRFALLLVRVVGFALLALLPAPLRVATQNILGAP
jgi:membrane protein required for colicin V production